jgi:hypothetical protein
LPAYGYRPDDDTEQWSEAQKPGRNLFDDQDK